MATFKQTIEGMKAMEQPENQQPQKTNPVTYYKPLSKEEGEDMRKKGMTEDEYRYKQASDRAILMGEQIPDKNEYMKGLAAKREAMQNQPKKTAGEIAKEMYEDIFFKEAKGNKEDFVNRWLNMGVPRGFSRKELADFYGKRFDELSANQPKAQQPKQGSFERAIRDIGDDED